MSMDNDKLREILNQHKLWMSGSGGERANLRGVDLRDTDLRGADLSGADLSGVYLSRVYLYNVNLSSASLYGANLSSADLRGADLSSAALCGADLSYADLRGADLCRADLCRADLYGANLCRANLRGADLYNADLRGADLREAELFGADLRGVNLFGAYSEDFVKTRVYPLACPEVGAFVGWKKCRNDVIVKLLIPEDAKRSSAYGRKCRCSKAITLAVFGGDGKTATSIYDEGVIYEVGKETLPVFPYNEDRWNECASGIHFFITRKEAEDFNL